MGRLIGRYFSLMEVTSALTAAWLARPQNSPNQMKNHDLGYSRGGYGTKIHLVRNANGNYINAVLSAGQEYETQHFEDVATKRKPNFPLIVNVTENATLSNVSS
ncbi:MAG: hypothetical protein Q4D62_13245 [Planctomycetia bacterium]|nr:hypothetical protein [Planctomycetia bacterium]